MKMAECRTDIRKLWLEQGFWPMLFSIVLLVIMILWRPSINNQRFVGCTGSCFLDGVGLPEYWAVFYSKNTCWLFYLV